MKINQKNLKQIVCISVAVAVILIVFLIVFIFKDNDKPNDDNPDISNPVDKSSDIDEPEELLDNEVQEVIASTSPKTDDINKAQEKNSEAVGWITIPNTKIDHPIMQTDNNSFYLNHNEKGEYDGWGCYFADYYASIGSVENLTQNTVIYGHTGSENPNGEKFSELYSYLDIDYLKKNPYIYLTIEDRELAFEIFAVFYSDTYFYYINPNPSENGFDEFIEDVNKRNEYTFTNTKVLETDKIVTLSGCSYKYDENDTGKHRFVVMAKLVHEEREDIAVTVNESPLRPK